MTYVMENHGSYHFNLVLESCLIVSAWHHLQSEDGGSKPRGKFFSAVSQLPVDRSEHVRTQSLEAEVLSISAVCSRASHKELRCLHFHFILFNFSFSPSQRRRESSWSTSAWRFSFTTSESGSTSSVIEMTPFSSRAATGRFEQFPVCISATPAGISSSTERTWWTTWICTTKTRTSRTCGIWKHRKRKVNSFQRKSNFVFNNVLSGIWN